MQKKTVIGFKSALEAGFQLQNYSWSADVVPVGEYGAVLDFMIWSKKCVAVDCFLTTAVNGTQIRLTAYRNQADDYWLAILLFRT